MNAIKRLKHTQVRASGTMRISEFIASADKSMRFANTFAKHQFDFFDTSASAFSKYNFGDYLVKLQGGTRLLYELAFGLSGLDCSTVSIDGNKITFNMSVPEQAGNVVYKVKKNDAHLDFFDIEITDVGVVVELVI